MPIALHDVWGMDNPEDYKVHFARNNGDVEPLKVWARSADEWRGWQEYRPKRNEFNRERIFALMQFYHPSRLRAASPSSGIFVARDIAGCPYRTQPDPP